MSIDYNKILTQKTGDLTNLSYNEINALSKEQLQILVKELARRSRQRRRRVENSKEFQNIKDVFAYKDWDSKKIEQKQKRASFDYGDFTGYSNLKFKYNDKMGVNELRSRYKTYSQFLNTQTSTVTGWKKTIKGFKDAVTKYLEKTVGTKKARQVSRYIGKIENYKVMFRVFSEIQKSYHIMKDEPRYNELRERLAEYMYDNRKKFGDMSEKDIFNELYIGFRGRLEKEYEKINMEDLGNDKKPISKTTIGAYEDYIQKR